jgi:hypothetical protein
LPNRLTDGSAFALSDLLDEAEWAPHFWAPAIQDGLHILVNAAIDLIAGPEAATNP